MSYTERLNTFLDKYTFDTDTLTRTREIIEPCNYACLFAYISGDSGCGKSHLIKSLADEYGITHVDCQPNLSITDFYDHLLDAHFANDIDPQESLVYRRHQVEKLLGQLHKVANRGTYQKSIIAFDNADKLSSEVLNEIYYLHDRLNTHSFMFILPTSAIHDVDRDSNANEEYKRYRVPNLTEYKRWNTLDVISRLYPEDLLFADILKSLADDTCKFDEEGDIVYKGNVSGVRLPKTPREFINKMYIVCGIADTYDTTPNLAAQFFPHLADLAPVSNSVFLTHVS